MKKIISFLLVLLLTAGAEMQALAAEASMTRAERLAGTIAFRQGSIFAVAEGTRTRIYPEEDCVSPRMEGSVLLLPLRFVAEQLGASVVWDGKAQSVTVSKDARTAVVTIDSADYIIDGKKRTAAQAAILEKSRTMVSADLLEDVLDIAYINVGGLEMLAPADTPWDPLGAAEQELAGDISLLLSPLVDMFTAGNSRNEGD